MGKTVSVSESLVLSIGAAWQRKRGRRRTIVINQCRELLDEAGYSDVRVIEERSKGWICAHGRKTFDAD
jgi:hypothetical protein